MMVVITGSVYTNQSNGAIFSMLTPFWITNILGEDSGESGLDGLTANWSFHNVSNNASIIQYSVQPIGDCSVIPCAGPIDASFTVAFNHLLFVDDHGKYTAIIPFEGYPFRTVKMLPLTFSTLVDLTNKVNFNNEFRDKQIITGSTPPYSYACFSYGLSKASLEYSYPSIGASTLTFTFEDPGEASNQQLAQALGFTLIGLGIPIAISTFVEWRKSSRPDGSNRDLSEDKFRDDREPDITG